MFSAALNPDNSLLITSSEDGTSECKNCTFQIYPPVCLSVYLSVYPPVCLPVHIPICLSVCRSSCVSVCLPISVCVFVFSSSMESTAVYHIDGLQSTQSLCVECRLWTKWLLLCQWISGQNSLCLDNREPSSHACTGWTYIGC